MPHVLSVRRKAPKTIIDIASSIKQITATIGFHDIPDGSYGFISTDRRCNVSYDFPAYIKIEIQPTVVQQQRSKQ